MSKEITTTQTVAEAMQTEFIDLEGVSTPVAAEFSYDAADPFAVSIFSICWIFAAASFGDNLKPSQPSPYSATRRKAALLSPPNHTGTPFAATGFG